MEPLSRRLRNIYLITLVFIFVILVPLTLLYSSGYRLGDNFTLVKTGGIYIGLNEPDTELFLNGKFVKEVGILKNGFFVQDLTPRVYHILVKKDGHRIWEKILEVKPQRVVEASAFILPNDIPLAEILLSDTSYEEVLELFATSTITQILPEEYPDVLSTTTRVRMVEDVKRKGDIVLWREGESIYARWVRDNNNNAPSYFCDNEGCNREIILNKNTVQYFDFHPQSNELVVIVINDVAVMTEIDPRIPRNEQTLFEARGVEVRISRNSIFFKEPTKDGVKIFEFEL